MQPKLQQLDLFGNPAQDLGGAKEKKKAKPAVVVHATLTAPVAAAEEVLNTDPVIIDAQVTRAPVTSDRDQKEEQVYQRSSKQVRKSVAIEKIAGKRGRKSYSEIDTEVDLIEIPDEKILAQKLYYTISEVASWFKVNTSLLRYWENEFDILKPRKTRKGDRLFRIEDIKNLQIIYFLLRQKKYSIEGARTYLKQNKSQADTEAQLVQSLHKFKSFLLELKAGLH
jgi:DNA-binding transcriptional MerR regulator